jgi:hypothetical protein
VCKEDDDLDWTRKTFNRHRDKQWPRYDISKRFVAKVTRGSLSIANDACLPQAVPAWITFIESKPLEHKTTHNFQFDDPRLFTRLPLHF